MVAGFTASGGGYFATFLPNKPSIDRQKLVLKSTEKLSLIEDHEFAKFDDEFKTMQTEKDNDGTGKERPSMGKHDSFPHDATLDPALLPSPPNTLISVQRPGVKHSRQNSSSIVRAEVDVDVQASNVRARERVEIMRGRVFRSRRKIQDLREDVRQLRERQWEASTELMKAVNQIMALGDAQHLGSLQPLYKKASDAQDDLGPVEEEYDRMESRLSYEEQELEQEEKFFYTHNDIRLRQLPDEDLDKSLSPLVKPYEPPGDENVAFDDETSQAFFEQLAKARDLKEALDNMETQYYRVTEEARFRKRHDLELSRESVDFLVNYDSIHRNALDELYEVEDDLYDLRERCLDEQLFGEDEYVYTRRDALVEDIMESVNEARERSPLRTAAKQHLIQPNFQDKRDYVNAWMLESVQDSIFEANRLRAYIYFEFEHSYQGKDGGNELEEEQWSNLAIRWWDRDTAGAKANECYMLSQMDAITGGNDTDFLRTTDLNSLESAESFGSDKKDRSINLEEKDFVDLETIDEFNGEAQSYTTERPTFTPNTTDRRPSVEAEKITPRKMKFWGSRSF